MTDKGKLPKGWQWVKLGDVCQIRGGKRLPIGADFSNTPTEHPYLRVRNFRNHTVITDELKYINTEIYECIRNYIIKKDDVYLSIAGTIGEVGIIPDSLDNSNLTENAVRLIVNSKIVSNVFLMLFLCSKLGQQEIRDRTNIVGQPKLAIERIKTITIPLPPLSEQRRIAVIIETQLAAVDKAKKAAAEQQAAAGALAEVCLREAFNFDELPEGWKEVKLEEVCKADKVIIHGSESDLPFLGLEMIESNTGFIDITARTMEGMSTCYFFDERHVLYGKLRPYLNKVSLPNFKGRCSTEIIPLCPKENTTRNYLALLLRRNTTVEYVMPENTGSRMPRASMEHLLNMKVFLPPLSEQQCIVTHLENKLAFAEHVNEVLAEQAEAINAMPAAILRKAFAGEM